MHGPFTFEVVVKSGSSCPTAHVISYTALFGATFITNLQWRLLKLDRKSENIVLEMNNIILAARRIQFLSWVC